jgi:glutathione S-transferase
LFLFFCFRKEVETGRGSGLTSDSVGSNRQTFEMVLTVHHLETSQSFRIVWLLEELGMSYQVKTYKREADNSAPPEYQSLSPLQTAPVITDEDTILSESNAIIDYILDCAGNSTLRPSIGSPFRTDYIFWFHAAQGTLMNSLSIDSLMRIIPTRVPWPINYIASMITSKVLSQRIEPRLKTYMNLAEKQLSKHDFFAGPELTAADVTSVYPMDAAFRRFPYFKEAYPKCRDWLERVSLRDSYKRAIAKTGDATVSLSL